MKHLSLTVLNLMSPNRCLSVFGTKLRKKNVIILTATVPNSEWLGSAELGPATRTMRFIQINTKMHNTSPIHLL